MEEFIETHGVQLYGMGFPSHLNERLFHKLTNSIFDAGSYFQIFKTVDEDDMPVGQELRAISDLEAESEVFLIDHAWSFRIEEMRRALKSTPGLADRIKNILMPKLDLAGFEDPTLLGIFDSQYSEHDEMGLESLPYLPPETSMLSLSGNNFQTLDIFHEILGKLKAFWIDNNPIDQAYVLDVLESSYPNIEIFNKKLTVHAGEWAMMYMSNKKTLGLVKHLDLSERGITRCSPNILDLCPSLVSLDLRDNELNDPWINYIRQIPSLTNIKVDQVYEDIDWNVKYVNGFDMEKGKPDEYDRAIEDMWKLMSSYRIITDDTYDERPVWYMLDELGSSILHSDEPNVTIMPFLYNKNISYSLLWAKKKIRTEDIIYKDNLLNISEADFRSYRLYPWFNIPQIPIKRAYKAWKSSLSNREPFVKENVLLPGLEGELKVITDLEFFSSSLTDPRFTLTENDKEADCIWTRKLISDSSEDLSRYYINQFPYEGCLVTKNNLCKTVQNNIKANWLPLTFELNTSLPAFIGEYLHRQKRGIDNHWILKPSNMARAIDCVMTNSLEYIIRQMDSGPKVAQKYIHKPLLLNGKKFDLRFIVIVRSFEPLSLMMHDKFFIRSANHEFNLKYDFQEDYETHFTVMNYGGYNLQRIEYDIFIEHFQQEHGDWDPVLKNIYKAVHELFSVAIHAHPDMQSDKSRAIYGLDIMLDTDYQPYILEVNFCPDCHRAVEYYPSYTNEIFNALFYSELTNITLI